MLVPGEAEVAHHLDELFHLARVLVRPVVEFDEQHGFGLFADEFFSVGRNIGIAQARSSIVLSISSTAMGRSFTRCWAAFIAS